MFKLRLVTHILPLPFAALLIHSVILSPSLIKLPRIVVSLTSLTRRCLSQAVFLNSDLATSNCEFLCTRPSSRSAPRKLTSTTRSHSLSLNFAQEIRALITRRHDPPPPTDPYDFLKASVVKHIIFYLSSLRLKSFRCRY